MSPMRGSLAQGPADARGLPAPPPAVPSGHHSYVPVPNGGPALPPGAGVAPGPLPHQAAMLSHGGCVPSGAASPFPAPPSVAAGSGYGLANGLGANLGQWSELIASGVVDREYIEQETARRKQEVDRNLDAQLVQLENGYEEQKQSIQQQAEYHLQMAERQIETHKRQHLAHVTRQAELQAYSITQRAEMEKGRLGQEAARALSQVSEREKSAVLYEATRRAEEVWRESQRALLEKAQKAKQEIDGQASRRMADIEQEVREAVSRVYVGSNTPCIASTGYRSAGAFTPELN